MNCRYIENNLVGYIENALPLQTMQEINNHLTHCNNCKSLELQVRDTYNILDKEIISTPDLFTGINRKLKKHHKTVIEFIPQHLIMYRVAASVIIVIGIGLGILLGGNYSPSGINDIQTVSNQIGTSDYNTTETNSMDIEPGLASLYPND